MLTLSIEQSTASCSAAILKDSSVLAEESWTENRRQGHQLFKILPQLLDSTSSALSDIDMFAVDLGPGSFSGLRIALAAARSMALPGNKQVFGVSSAEALAWEIREKYADATVIIVGDARRGFLWTAQFSPEDKSGQTGSISLLPVSDLAAIVNNGAVVASPDWNRIGDTLKRTATNNSLLIEEQRSPGASTVGQIAFAKTQKGYSSLPLTPLYLHPAARPNPIDSAAPK